ncbi:MAG: hypothetical protein V4617_06930 [Gemmatimonadota bacterium]
MRRTMRGLVQRAMQGAMLLATVVPEADAQAPGRLPAALVAANKVTERAMGSLDRWIVERYRGAQLLADSLSVPRSVTPDAVLPRVETVRGGTAADTLLALHFSPRAGSAALLSGSVVRIAGSTGTITPMSATVLARRPFRAPRLPMAKANADDWRYGWAYLVILPKAGRALSATTFRGWLLLDAAAVK